jgi:hypothetical protein
MFSLKYLPLFVSFSLVFPTVHCEYQAFPDQIPLTVQELGNTTAEAADPIVMAQQPLQHGHQEYDGYRHVAYFVNWVC